MDFARSPSIAVSRYIDVSGNEAPLAFRLRKAEQAEVPPIVMLHGLGGDEKVMWSLESALPGGALIVAARAPHAQEQGGYAWNSEIKAWPPLVSEFDESIVRLEQLFDYLNVNFEFQIDRAILMGFSNGTAMSFAASMKPMKFKPAGIIGIAGHLPKGDLSQLRGIPVFWGHGIRDSFIPIETARSDVARLRETGVEVTYCEDEVGHKLGVRCMKRLRPWFQAAFPAPEMPNEGIQYKE